MLKLCVLEPRAPKSPVQKILHYFHAVYLLCLLPLGQLLAEESTETQVIVHGANYEQELKEVPGSVSVIDQQDLTRSQAKYFSDLQLDIPNLNMAGGSSRYRFFQIRGVGELEQYEGAPNTSVGFIVDGIDLSGLSSATSFWDLSTIEVFRGPQATRFGSSALAGVINLESNSPTSVTEGKLKLGLGTDDLQEAALAFGGAIPGTSEELSARFSTSVLGSNGFRDNAFLNKDDTNHFDNYSNRLKLAWNPNSDFHIEATVFSQRQQNGYDAFSIDNSLTTQSDKPGQDLLKTNAVSLNLSYDLSPTWQLTSLSTWSHNALSYSYDADWGNDSFWSPYLPYDYQFQNYRTRKTLTQEMRVNYGNSLEYIHGESFRSFLASSAKRLIEDTSIQELASSEAYRDYTSNYAANTWSVYGDLEIPLGYSSSLDLGGRSEWRYTDFADNAITNEDFQEEFQGGSLSLNHDFTDSTRGYLLVSRGFRGGGFNTGTRVTPDLKHYAPEYLWNYEVGTKTNLLGTSLSLNNSLFYNLRSNQQVQVSFQDDPTNPAAFSYITQNAARGRSYGLESELRWNSEQNWGLRSSVSLLWAEFTDFEGGNFDLSGRDQSHAPRWQYSLGPIYNFTEHLQASINFTGQAAFYFDDKNDQRSDAYHLVHSNLSYAIGPCTIDLWVKNLFNERYANRGFYFQNEPPDFPTKLYIQRGDPRQFGASLSYVF